MSSSTSRTSRCSDRVSGSCGRRERSRSACRTSARTFASIRRSCTRCALPVDRGDRHREARRQDGRRDACRPPARRATAAWSVVAMGRGRTARAGARATRRRRWKSSSRCSRAGRHAASDYLETAVLAGVPTIGCRRAGGGLAGATFDSNVLEGAALAASLDPDSSCSTAAARRSRRSPPTRGSSSRRRPRSPGRTQRLPRARLRPRRRPGGTDHGAVRALKDVPVVRAELRLRPATPLRGRGRGLHGRRRARPTTSTPTSCTSRATSRAATALREELERIDAETYLVELKAAAIDVVAEHALARGAEIVLAANDVVADGLDGRCSGSCRGGVREVSQPRRMHAAAARGRARAPVLDAA